MRKTMILILLTGIIFSVDYNAYGFPKLDNTEKINIVSTSDLHGRIDGYDYSKGINLPVGLDRIATIVKKQKLYDKDTVVIDGGDFNRGNPMADMYNLVRYNEDNPIVSVMNKIGYDAATPGNHELDYGIKNLNKIKREAEFPIVSANIYYNNKLLFKPYEIIKRKGITIGIVGFTTTSALRYNSGDDIQGIKIEDIPKEADKYFRILKDKEKADVIIAIIHSGIEGVYDAPADETDVRKVTELPVKPDIIISGHSHMVIPYMAINNVIVQSPGAMGIGTGKLNLTLKNVDGKWNIVNSSGIFIPAFIEDGDKNIEMKTENYKDKTNSYLNTGLGRLDNMKSYTNNSLIDTVKRMDAGADIVLDEGMKDQNVNMKNISIKDLYDIYSRENYIIGITVKGRNVKMYLQNRLKKGLETWNNIYGATVANENGDIELYVDNKKINDEDNINVAITGRQLKYDPYIKKSGIINGSIYYNSFLSNGFEGRVRQRIEYYIRRRML